MGFKGLRKVLRNIGISIANLIIGAVYLSLPMYDKSIMGPEFKPPYLKRGQKNDYASSFKKNNYSLPYEKTPSLGYGTPEYRPPSPEFIPKPPAYAPPFDNSKYANPYDAVVAAFKGGYSAEVVEREIFSLVPREVADRLLNMKNNVQGIRYSYNYGDNLKIEFCKAFNIPIKTARSYFDGIAPVLSELEVHKPGKTDMYNQPAKLFQRESITNLSNYSGSDRYLFLNDKRYDLYRDEKKSEYNKALYDNKEQIFFISLNDRNEVYSFDCLKEQLKKAFNDGNIKRANLMEYNGEEHTVSNTEELNEVMEHMKELKKRHSERTNSAPNIDIKERSRSPVQNNQYSCSV